MGLLESLLTGYTEALMYKYMKIQFKENHAMTAVKIGGNPPGRDPQEAS